MTHTIENETLRVTARETGAELCSVFHKPTGTELLWSGDKAVWGGQAPILFPHCGALYEGKLWAKGQAHESARHGFARRMPFSLVELGTASMRLRLEANGETRALYPYEFRLDSVYTLEGDRLAHTMEVTNPSATETLPFNVGYHPAFAVTDGGEGWVFEFEGEETPFEIVTGEGGLVTGEVKRHGRVKTIPVTGDLFARDSICFAGLASPALTLRQAATGRAVRVGIAGFPYVLLWGQPKGPHRYLCIEPWHGVPDPAKPYGEFAQKPGITLLAPGQSFNAEMPMEFFMG